MSRLAIHGEGSEERISNARGRVVPLLHDHLPAETL